MILDKIMVTLTAVLNSILGLFPAWALPFDPASIADPIAQAVQVANGFFPVTTLGACISAVAGLWVVLNGWSVVVWLYNKFPGKFT
ncbi:hypothetical protein [Nocardioides sp. HB32]